MCGEIEEWQKAKQFNVRLTTNGQATQITLSDKFDQVEEIRLDECMFTGFNGGTSGAVYLEFTSNGFNSSIPNNEAKSGVLLMVDVLNPHTTFQRPKLLARGHLLTLNSFQIRIVLPSGAAVAFTEASFSLTAVCRKGADEIAEVRRLKATALPPPSIKDGMASNAFNPK